MEIKYETFELLTPELGVLWQKQRDHHADLSTHFREFFNDLSWESRKTGFLNKSAGGALKVFAVRNGDSGIMIGYLIGLIDEKKAAVIESLFLEEEYRGRHIGSTLMEQALAWFKELDVKSESLVVAVGNEQVSEFYKSFDFYPRYTTYYRKTD